MTDGCADFLDNAVNLPLDQIAEALSLSEATFQTKYGFAKPKPTDAMVVYCRAGVRSTTAHDIVKAAGFNNTRNYKGSWLDWAQRTKQ
jgi:rhodanese-related sulfurtransferase